MLIDVSLPLCRGRIISVENGKTMWITFKYERLPNICYLCGRLEHNDRDGDLWLESKGFLTADQKQFGPTLRASPFVSSQKVVVSIPSFSNRNNACLRNLLIVKLVFRLNWW